MVFCTLAYIIGMPMVRIACSDDIHGQSSDYVYHWNMLFRPLFQPICHQNAIQWKYHRPSTIMVLNLQWLGNFPLFMYHSYHVTSSYTGSHSSRLIVIYYSTMVPNPHGTWYDCTMPSIIGSRHGDQYQATVATRQWNLSCSQQLSSFQDDSFMFQHWNND